MDDFVNAVKTCLRKYADFSGRAARPEFWWFVLAQFLAVFVVSIVSDLLSTLVSLGLLLPALSVGARRLHDIGKSGWFQLLWIVPIIGWILLIYWACQPGQSGANAYGQPPGNPQPAIDVAPGQQ